MKKKYSVNLSNCGNPDYGQNPHSPLSETTTGWYDIDSISEARAMAIAYILSYDLGAGNWNGGQIKLKDSDEIIAQISYNGRVWDISNGKTIENYVEYPILASENTFILPTVQSTDRKMIIDFLIKKASEGIDCFQDADTWVGSDDPIYGSPLGFDVNIYEGETGAWIVNVYALKIDQGSKGIDTSAMDFYQLEDGDVEKIHTAYLESKSEKRLDVRSSGLMLHKLEEKIGPLTEAGFNMCKNEDFYEINSMEAFKSLCADSKNLFGGSEGQFVKLKPGHPLNQTEKTIVVIPSIAEALRSFNEKFTFQSQPSDRDKVESYSAVYSGYTNTIRTPIEGYCIARIVENKESGRKELDFDFCDAMVRDYVWSHINKLANIDGLTKTDNNMIFEFTEDKPKILQITKEISSLMKDCTSLKAKEMSVNEFESVFTSYIYGKPAKTPVPFIDPSSTEDLFAKRVDDQEGDSVIYKKL